MYNKLYRVDMKRINSLKKKKFEYSILHLQNIKVPVQM